MRAKTKIYLSIEEQRKTKYNEKNPNFIDCINFEKKKLS
jgi:hypothetical protein